MDGIEPSTSPLPRVCSTPELHEQAMERAAGIEPAPSAWKAEVLPLNYARLPTLCPPKYSRHIEFWWRGKDSNLRSLRGRFTVCSLWPLGNPSNVAANYTTRTTTVKNQLPTTCSRRSFPRRSAFCQSSIKNASPTRTCYRILVPDNIRLVKQM